MAFFPARVYSILLSTLILLKEYLPTNQGRLRSRLCIDCELGRCKEHGQVRT